MADKDQIVEMTAEIVAAHVANNAVAVGDMPDLIEKVHGALARISSAAEQEDKRLPAVPIKGSVKPSYIVCLECGRRQKALRRHLKAAHGMTPEQYREGYGLPHNYPMAAPNYSKRRREMAKEIGLGRKKGSGEAGTKGRPNLRETEADQISLREGTH